MLCKCSLALFLIAIAATTGRAQPPGSQPFETQQAQTGRVQRSSSEISLAETLPPLVDDRAPTSFDEMWAGFDPRNEPLEVETLHQWQQDGVTLQVVRFRVGVFKGQRARLAAVYGYPSDAGPGGRRVPGLVQVHGGGQYANARACLANAKRGYATVSIAWAGRISAPDYHVGPPGVELFWDGKTDDPAYKVTTDWGAVDGYHAPGRNPRNAFPSVKAEPWTLDSVDSPRNSGWFLGAMAVRRALTFLEQQPEVDADRLGVYGHSMGGKLTVLAAFDDRVKAAAPSCGGISDRDNPSPLYRSTLGDQVSLKRVTCPMVFLSPSNDFHGRIGDLPSSIDEIQNRCWRVTCSPHRNHQDTAEYEVASLLWFDQHLQGNFSFPSTPETTLRIDSPDGVPRFTVSADNRHPILSVDIYYTEHGRDNETPKDRESTMNRHWHHVSGVASEGKWTAKLPLSDQGRPLWAYANVVYPLDPPIDGVGYYYAPYTARTFNVSSLIQIVSAEELESASVRRTRKRSLMIESFSGDWQKQWFRNRPNEWACATHKLRDVTWHAPERARLSLTVRCEEANSLVVQLDQHAAVVELPGGDHWHEVHLEPGDFEDHGGHRLPSWDDVWRLTLCPATTLAAQRGSTDAPRVMGGRWNGPDPSFESLRWTVAEPKTATE